MSEFIIIAQDRHAKMFHIFKDGVFKISSHKSPGNIAQELLDNGDAVSSDRFELRSSENRIMLNHSVASAASYSDDKSLQSLKRDQDYTAPTKRDIRDIRRDFSAHLPPEPINAGGDAFSPSSPATSFSNERGFLGS